MFISKKAIFSFFVLLTFCFQSKAQLNSDDPIAVLFAQIGDEINCLSVQVLLSSYPKNINDFDCEACKYDESNDPKAFYPKITYSKTKRIAQGIFNKKNELLKGLSLDNFSSQLQLLADYSIKRSEDKSSKKEEKTEKLKLLLEDKIAEANRKYDVVLASESAEDDFLGSETQNQQEDILAEDNNDGFVNSNNENLDLVDGLGSSKLSEWLIWIALAIGIISIAVVVITLMNLKKINAEMENIKRTFTKNSDVDHKINQNEAKLNKKIKRLEEDEKRITERIDQLENKLIGLMRN